MFGSREEFVYFLCSTCGCLQIAAIPNNLAKYYPANYYSLTARQQRIYKPFPRAILERFRVANALFGRSDVLNDIAAQLVNLPSEWSELGPILKSCGIKNWRARFLDVGCGSWSWWLQGLKGLGFRTLFGVDPHIDSDVSIDGIHIHKGQIADLTGPFDLITLHHSLEHIPDHIGTLEAIRGLLAPNGACLVRVPLVSSLVWEMYGTDWVELDAPRHLYLHSLKSIELTGQRAGLRLETTTFDSTAFEFYGSEQYRRGIALFADNSFGRNPSLSDFTYREMAQFSALAERANRERRGGRGCFLFRAT